MLSQELINQFERIFIDEKSRDSYLAQRIITLFPEDKIEFVTDQPLKDIKGALTAEQFNQSKRLLYVKPFEGQFFKRCPGVNQKKALPCCNYYVLNLGQQCNMNCSYCYLQGYLNSPTMVMYSNIDDALTELRQVAEIHSELPYRVGTGEVVDSLSLDEISLFSRPLIEFFKSYPKWTLEFKTKSDRVEQFLDCEHVGNVVVSWSVNTPHVIASEEHGTADLEARLNAARRCADRGFPISFHFDPLIYYADWKSGYQTLITEIQNRFSPKEIRSISVGALRFQPEQRHLMRERFGMKSLVASAEVFPSDGGKYRYDSRLRQEMLEFVIKRFQEHNLDWRVIMCMETPESWLATYEKSPMLNAEIKQFFRPLPKIRAKLLASPKIKMLTE